MLAWGSGEEDPVLAVSWADGSVAAYHPARSSEPSWWFARPAGRGRPRALLVLPDERVIVADDAGLTLHGPKSSAAPSNDLFNCGPVGALAADPRTPRDVVVGLASGRLVRIRLPAQAGEAAEVVAEWRSSGPSGAILGLSYREDGRSMLVLRDPGSLVEISSTLDGEATYLGDAPAFWQCGSALIIAGPGPSLTVV
jgi:hypothetical protein